MEEEDEGGGRQEERKKWGLEMLKRCFGRGRVREGKGNVNSDGSENT